MVVTGILFLNLQFKLSAILLNNEFTTYIEDSKILRHPEEYDNQIPNVTFAQYVIDRMQEFGKDTCCVRF